MRILMFLILSPIGLLALQPLNLDFEKQSAEGVTRPWGWNSTVWGADFKMDSLNVKKGNYSLHSKCHEKENPCINQALGFNIETYDLLGKNITLTGHLKGEKIENAVSFSIHYTLFDDISNNYSFEEIISEKLSGTFDWKEISLHLKVPKSATQFSLSINQEGQGEAWFDDFKLVIGENQVTEVNAAKAFSKEHIDWLTRNVKSFKSPLPSLGENKLITENLSFFKDAIGSSRIVALGESTHGTSEFFSLKHKLLQYAVIELGFRVFALEDHLIAGEAINAYVTKGIGTLKQATRGLFGTWNTVEVFKMMQWIGDYNVTHPDDMVYFIGVDIQEITGPIDSLVSFIKVQDSKLYEKHKTVLSVLKEKGENHFMERDSLVKLDWIKSSENIHNELSDKKRLWISLAKTKAQKLKIEYGIQYANMVQQYFKEVLNTGRDLYRDQAMAENASWYFEKIYPNKKMMIWAHDSHVSRGEHDDVFTNFNRGISMGYFLSKKYKSDYKSFGLATYSGDFLAFKTYAYKEQVHAPLFPSPIGSLEEALHQVAIKKKQRNLFTNLPRSIAWLNKPMPLRFANHVNIDYGYWGRLAVPYQFDGLFFIDKTTSAKPNKN